MNEDQNELYDFIIGNKIKGLEEINKLVESISSHRRLMSGCADKLWEDSGKLVLECIKLIEKYIE